MVMSGALPYDRAVLAGVRAYGQAAAGWSLRLLRIVHQLRPEDLLDLEVEGLLVRGLSAHEITAPGLPVVSIGYDAPAEQHSVAGDEHFTGALAAEHLVGLGMGQLVFFYRGDLRQSEPRWQGFAARARELNVPCTRFLTGPRTQAHGTWRLNDQLADLADLLHALPRPIGLGAADDTHGERAIQACRLAGLAVPEDVAVVCHSTDDDFCELADPPLSSLAPDPVRIGRLAAELLDQLMAGQPVPPGPRLVPPEPVIIRDSSNFIAVSDPLVDQATRLIRQDIGQLHDVADLVAALPTTRPTLERRFRKALHRSPARELRRVRLHRAQQLLRETDFDLATISEHAGFGGICQLCRQVKQETGLTPTSYRRQYRQGHP